jgi:hypothetical protein
MRRFVLMVMMSALFVSCGQAVPKELSLSKELDLFTVHYPADWKAETGLGGGVTLTNASETMVMPINVMVDPNSRKNDVRSIPDILSIFQRGASGGKMWIKKLSGYQCIWAESELFGEKLALVYVPLDGVIISVQPQPRKSGNNDITSEDLKIAYMITENLEIK